MSNHNNRILNTDTTKTATNKCNCRDKNNCPLQGNCLQESVVYKATIKTDTTTETYIGSTETTFKTRYNNHKTSMKYESKAKQTKLSIQYWKHAKQGKTPTITWEIIKECHPYKCGTTKCDICVAEKLEILRETYKQRSNIINKRSELINTCSHISKHRLKDINNKQKPHQSTPH